MTLNQLIKKTGSIEGAAKAMQLPLRVLLMVSDRDRMMPKWCRERAVLWLERNDV